MTIRQEQKQLSEFTSLNTCERLHPENCFGKPENKDQNGKMAAEAAISSTTKLLTNLHTYWQL